MKKPNFSAFKALIKKSNNIVIVTHWSPDGDAMGSSLGLYNYLLKIKKKATVVVPNEYPEFLKWLPGDNKVLNHQLESEKVEKLVLNADAIFTLDFNSYKRIEKLGEIVAASKAVKVLIDHHQQPDKFAKLVLHNVKACSTSELIYDLIIGLGHKKLIDKKIAACLYTGLMTDTGSFRFPSVTEKTHLIVADLVKHGAVPNQIHEAVYDTYAYNRLKLIGYAILQKMMVLPGKNIAYISLSEDELKQFNFQKGDTEGLVNYPLTMKGTKFSAFFAEMDGKVKISFRSKGKFDVNQFARLHFSGGGHINAAGGKSDLSLNDTIAKFLEIVSQPGFIA
ncbi:MAG TPA: bifunctional oligoribonuclease/PAP phosphatase NrnA [Bacteroidia bacterium]|jgi:phosphoesterase RecJ-like protein|nr:bifunctional oligoribonuclease/PAP phosphatase NrnA [Bacteroidia bacterium]